MNLFSLYWCCHFELIQDLKRQTRTMVEPLIMDPPNKGHNRNNLSINTFEGPNCSVSHNANTFQSLYKGGLVPTCPLFGGSTDNVSE